MRSLSGETCLIIANVFAAAAITANTTTTEVFCFVAVGVWLVVMVLMYYLAATTRDQEAELDRRLDQMARELEEE